MSTFMGLPDSEYFVTRPSPMPVHSTFGIIEPGTTVKARGYVGRVCYPDELTIQGAEPEMLDLPDDEQLQPWDKNPWFILASYSYDDEEVETALFLHELTEIPL